MKRNRGIILKFQKRIIKFQIMSLTVFELYELSELRKAAKDRISQF